MVTSSCAELERLSSSGDLAEAIGVAVGVPAVVVTGPTTAGVSPALLSDLGSLPCVLIGAPGGAFPEELVDVVPPADELDNVLRTIDANPLAATALVMLLRGGARRSLADGLVAESATYSLLQSGPEFATWWKASRRGRAESPVTEPRVLLDRAGDVLTLTLNRPDVHNAYDSAMRDELVDALRLAHVDSEVRVVLRGRGRSFCSGGDLAEFGSRSDPASAHGVRLARSAARLLAGLAERTTAYLHGSCIGSGIELAAFASTVIADPNTSFALPEVRFGLVPGAGGTVSLPARIGRQRTALLALCGHSIDAATGLTWGLVDQIDPAHEST